ncbi:pantetheine-phosphate adenylyltransferase [bacterium]|nr:pantetheine-phosphate adenylyltransferase [candidate division CSSED10-310 bacterium]
MTRAIYPGSFDPLTNGHLDIIKRSLRLFDNIIVCLAINREKQPLFNTDERLDILRQVIGDEPRASVTVFETLLVDYAQKMNADAIIRGLRAVSDFEFEFQMALMNRQLAPAIETVYLMPSARYSFLSSRLVKEVASFGGNVSDLVPPIVNELLKEKYHTWS